MIPIRGARSIGTLLVLPAIVWAVWSAGSAAPSAARSSADPVAALARGDARAPAWCRRSLHAGVAVVVCGARRRSLPLLAARGRRGVWLPHTRPARALAGTPLAAGERVTVRRRARSSRTQLVAVAAVGGTLEYVRYRLPAGARLSATLRVLVRGARPRLRLRAGGADRASLVERWWTPPPSPSPAPTPTATPVAIPAMVPLPSGPTTFRECGAIAPVDAGDAAGFDRLWHDERNGPGWTGGDGAVSVQLADGRIAWLFGDSFIGGVLSDGRRGPDSPMVRNSIVVQDGACLTTAIGGTTRWPTALMRPEEPDEWYWPEAATAEGQILHVAALRMRRTGPGAWDFAVAGIDVVDLDLASFTVTARRTLPVGGTVLWGSSIVAIGGTTYVYGVEDTPADARLFLAQASGPGLTGAWQFYTGDREAPWSTDPQDAAPLGAAPDDPDDPAQPLTGLPPAITVLDASPGVVLVSQAPLFGTAVLLRRAAAPYGPFSAPVPIATAAPPPVAGAFTYGAILHPDLAADGLQLLSWNVNTSGDPLADATLYRPRFAAVALPPAVSGTARSGPRAGAPAARAGR